MTTFAMLVRAAVLLVLMLSVGLAGLDAGAQRRPAASAVDLLDEGGRALRRGEYFQALQRFREANRLNGDRCAECLTGMADAMLGMKAYQNALDTSATAIDLAQSQPKILARLHGLRGDVFQALADTDATKYRDAETEFRLAADLDPEEDAFVYGLGIVLLKQQRDADGIAALEKFLTIRDIGPRADEARAMIANPRRARESFLPLFSLVTADRKTITPESLRGQVVLFDFWATVCTPCVSALASIRKLQQQYADAPLVIVSISADDDEEAWRRFTAKNSMVWPQVRDGRHDIGARFNVDAYPTYILVDREGVERFRVANSGFNRARDLIKAIDKELASR